MIEKKPERFEARAYLLGDRLDVRGMDAVERLAASPLTIRVGDTGYAVLFRYGAVVLFGLDAGEEMAFLATLGPRVRAPLGEAEVEVETTTIVLDPDCREGVGAAGEVLLRELGIGRLQIVADALAKSVFLAHYEARVSRVFDQVEPL
ncbi:MAG: RMD1 family protein, partial [Acidobacteriota bacterium]